MDRPTSQDEPPRKRQRLAPSTSTSTSTTTTTKNPEVANMDPPAKQTVTSDTGFQPEREKEVGILCFVNEETRGFTGILKQRYTDFLVNEIGPDGKVVHLTDDKAPKATVRTEEAPKSLTGATDGSASTAASNTYQESFPSLPTSTNALATPSENVKEATTLPPGAPADPLAKEAGDEDPKVSGVSAADQELLTQYFGATLKDEILTLHERILGKPTAKPAVFGSLLSEPITDRPLRGKMHQDVRRIFDSKLETESIDEGKIRISAAPPRKAHPEGRFKKENPRQQNSRNQPKGKVGWAELGGEHLHFSLYKENKDTMEVIGYLSYALKVKAKDFAFAGTKDRRAVTVQRVSVYRQNAKALAQLNQSLRQARIGDFSYEKHRLELGELDGNQFIITLRGCHFGDDEHLKTSEKVGLAVEVVGQAVQNLQAGGFLNYFGLQRFGTYSTGTDEIGRRILMNDFKGAVDLILGFSPETLEACKHPELFAHNKIGRDDLDRAWAINEFRNTGKAYQALDRLPKKFSAEANVIRHLGSAQHQSDWVGALNTIQRNLRTMYVHAYQSLVWNFVVSKRWEMYGNKVMEGDLVIVDTPAEKAAESKDEVDENGEIVIHPAADDVAVTHDDLYQRARALTAEEASSGKYDVFDIVLPTPGYDIEYPQNKVGDFYKEFMSSARGGGLDPADMRRNIKDFSLSGSYRKLIGQFGKDMCFEIKTYLDETEQLVETDLEKLQKSRGQDPRAENAPRNFDHGKGRDGYQNNRGGRGRGRGGRGRGNDFSTNRPNGSHRQENQPPRQERSSRENQSGLQRYTDVILEENNTIKPEEQMARLSGWQNLPAKLAPGDKAVAAAYEASRQVPVDVNAIKQPIYKDTFIQFSSEESRRTGYRPTTLIGDAEINNEVINESVVTDEDTTMEEPKVVEPAAPVSEVMDVDIRVLSLPAELLADKNLNASFATSSSDDSVGGGVSLNAKLSPTKVSSSESIVLEHVSAVTADMTAQDSTSQAILPNVHGQDAPAKSISNDLPAKRSAIETAIETAAKKTKSVETSPSKLRTVESATPATAITVTQDENGNVKILSHDSPKKCSAADISVITAADKPKSSLNPESPNFQQSPKLDAEKPKSPTIFDPESPIFEPAELAEPKIAVIIKFSLGTSQYATMALRELMKSGGVKTYKPDFSSGR